MEQKIAYTIIDIPSGLIAHCETYEAAIHFREIIRRGTIISPAAPVYDTAIREARATREKGGDYVRL